MAMTWQPCGFRTGVVKTMLTLAISPTFTSGHDIEEGDTGKYVRAHGAGEDFIMCVEQLVLCPHFHFLMGHANCARSQAIRHQLKDHFCI